MNRYSKSLIVKEAGQIKTFIEKNRKIPKACNLDGIVLSPYSVSYLMAKVIVDNFRKDVDLVDVILYDGVKVADSIDENVLKDDYLNMCSRFITYCQKNHRVPSYVTTKKSQIKVSFELFMYCLAKIIVFYQENKYLPNYCTFTKGYNANNKNVTSSIEKKVKQSTSTSKKTSSSTNLYVSAPHYTSEGCNRLGQCTPYYCGPHSIHQAIRKFGIIKYTEKDIASWCGTTTAGSSHNGINTAIAKISKLSGKKLSVKWKNFSDMGKTDEERFKAIGKLLANRNTAIIWHIAYINGGASTNGTHFGHYEYVDKINNSTKYVRALNSLGNRKSDGSYEGRVQDRPYSVQAYFAHNTPGNQAALCIITLG